MKTVNILLGAIFLFSFTHELKSMTRYALFSFTHGFMPRYVLCTFAGFLGGRYLPFFHKKDRLDHIEMQALNRTNEYSNDDFIDYLRIKREISDTGEQFTSSDSFVRMLACTQNRKTLPQINKCWDLEINYNKAWSDQNK